MAPRIPLASASATPAASNSWKCPGPRPGPNDEAAPLEGERKQVTVLFADVMGSMDLAEQIDPEEWRRIMDRFFAILCEGVHRFEGTVDKFTGDGIMALFGAPIAHEDHAQRACYAALHLQRELAADYAAELRRAQGLSFSVRMGINSGEVVVGTIGEDLGMEYTAIGHTVGLAQRMEQLAEPGKAYLTEHTATLVEGYLALDGPRRVPGQGRQRAAAGPRADRASARRAARLDVSRARGFSRFVGRDEELRMLEERAGAGAGRAGRGDRRRRRRRRRQEPALPRVRRALPGARASRSTRRRARRTARRSRCCRCSDHARVLRDHGARLATQTARERIAGKLAAPRRGLRGRPAADLRLPRRARPGAPRAADGPRGAPAAAAGVIKRLIHAQSAREPGVTVFEDLHWLDPASEAFLANQSRRSQGTRDLTIVNFRPEYHAPWMSKSYYRQIAAGPARAGGDQALLADLLGADPSLDGLADLIRERTGGNPFFIEEVVRALVEAGNLEGERGAYRLVSAGRGRRGAGERAGASSRRGSTGSPSARRRVLQAAAVIGKEFPEPVLRTVVADSRRRRSTRRSRS